MIGNRALRVALGTHHRAADMSHQDLHPILFQAKENIGYFPGSIQT
jgi:hypothetical protein